MDSPAAIFCRRCSRELTPGRGDFYVVRVEAYADPSPPVITKADLEQDHQKVMKEVVAGMKNHSPQELMDMVYRRTNFYLCAACYRQWIEDPTG
jgi:hypothetical protein